MEYYDIGTRHIFPSWNVNLAITGCHSLVSSGNVSFSHIANFPRLVDMILKSLWFHLPLNPQSIVENDDFHVVLASTSTLAETVNEFIGRIMESNHDDDNLVLKCNALKEKVEFLLNFLKGDELNKEDVVTSNQTTTTATTTAVAGDEGVNGARDKRDRSVERLVIKAKNMYS